MRRVVPSSIILMFLLQAPALAAVVFHLEIHDKTEASAKADRAQVTIEGNLLRMDLEFEGGETPRESMIYRGDRDVVWAIDHTRREVMRFDKESVAEVGDMMSEARQQMEAQLANLPPEQRAMVEKMMKGKMPGVREAASPPPVEVKATSERGKSHGYSWTKYEVFQEGEKVRELLVTGWDEVGIDQGTFDVFTDMSEFFREVTEPLVGEVPMDNPFAEMEKLDGFPVVIRRFERGKLVEESILKSVENTKVDPGTFDAPKDYKQTKMAERQ